jgi:hypothetical protein
MRTRQFHNAPLSLNFILVQFGLQGSQHPHHMLVLTAYSPLPYSSAYTPQLVLTAYSPLPYSSAYTPQLVLTAYSPAHCHTQAPPAPCSKCRVAVG